MNQPQPTINYSVFPAPQMPFSGGRRRRRNRNKKKKEAALKKKLGTRMKLNPFTTFFMLTIFSPVIGPLVVSLYAYLIQASVMSAQQSLEVLKGFLN